MSLRKTINAKGRDRDKKKYILIAMALGNVLLAGDIIKELISWFYRIGWNEIRLLIAAGGLSETLIFILLIAGAIGLLKRDRLWGFWGACAAAMLHSFHYLVVMPYFWGYDYYIPGIWLLQVPWTMFLYCYPIVFLIVINTKRIRTVFVSRNKKPVLVLFIVSLALVDYLAITFPGGAPWTAIIIGLVIVLIGYGPSEIAVPGSGPKKRNPRLQAEPKMERSKSVVGISVFLAVLLSLTGFYLKDKIGPYRLEIRENIKKEKMEKQESTLYNILKSSEILARTFPDSAGEQSGRSKSS